MQTRTGRLLVVLTLCLAAVPPVSSVLAHGVAITYTLTPVMAIRIELMALDAAGEPLSKAVVAVYAPGQDEAWFSTELDKTGTVSVIPDIRLAGTWSLMIREGDRSAVLRLPLEFGADYARVAGGEPIHVDARGIAVSYTLIEIPTVAIALDAAFEGGDAMSEAQVSVYAPNNAKIPWLIGTCDSDGHYEFVADSTNAGIWDIQVRKAGHGEWINIELDSSSVQISDAGPGDSENESTLSLSENVAGSVESDDGYTTGQIVLMSASVIWGMIGTALYVTRRRDTSP